MIILWSVYLVFVFIQTWEDVDHTEPSTGTKGDNDPLDVCEIGQTVSNLPLTDKFCSAIVDTIHVHVQYISLQ